MNKRAIHIIVLILLSCSVQAQTKFSLRTSGMFSISNDQFAAFADWSIHVEHKIHPAFGLFGDFAIKRAYENTKRGIAIDIGAHYYKKPKNYWELGAGLYYFNSINQVSRAESSELIPVTGSMANPFLSYLVIQKHHVVSKFLDFRYGIEYGYKMRLKEGIDELVVNDLEKSVIYLGLGIDIHLYQLHAKIPYEE